MVSPNVIRYVTLVNNVKEEEIYPIYVLSRSQRPRKFGMYLLPLPYLTDVTRRLRCQGNDSHIFIFRLYKPFGMVSKCTEWFRLPKYVQL